MAGENTTSTLEGLHKEVYGNKLNELVPNSSIIYDLVPFDDASKTGDSFHQPVTLTSEHGATYNGDGGTVVTLNEPIQADLKDASTKGFEFIMRSRLSYTAASRAAKEGKQAFAKAWGVVLKNLRLASMKRQELTFLRGQLGLGVVQGNAAGVLTITQDSWSPTTWSGMEGAVLEAWTSTANSATQHNADLKITAINYTNRTITVTGTNAAVVANDVLYFKGARTASGFNEGPGLIKIAQNSGSMFGIDAAIYSLWGGNVKGSFGAPTMGRYLDALTLPVEKGGLDENAILLVPPKAWEVLNADLYANRRFDGSYSKEKAENGSQRICYYGQSGELEVRAHPYLQRAESVIFPVSAYSRVGSADIGMGVPGTDGRDVFFHLQDKNAVEARTFSDQTMFCTQPSTSVYVNGIVYT